MKKTLTKPTRIRFNTKDGKKIFFKGIKTIVVCRKTMKAWGFIDKATGDLFPLSVCPILATRSDARYEKRKHNIYYKETQIIPVIITY